MSQQSNFQCGDIIDINGTKAIIYKVDELGLHGVAMSVKCLRGIKDMWCRDNHLDKTMPSTLSEYDGMENTRQIIAFAKRNGVLQKFPVFEWCNKLGEQWYIPSKKELEDFVNFWLGNEQTLDWDSEEEIENEIDENQPYYKKINKTLIDAGGVPFINGVFTSTVTADGKVYVFWFNRQKNTWSFKKESKANLSKYLVGRAFIRF